MTNTQSSIVTEVSAIFVLRTIFRFPLGAGRNTAACSSLDRVECSGTRVYFPDLEKGKHCSHIVVSTHYALTAVQTLYYHREPHERLVFPEDPAKKSKLCHPLATHVHLRQ